MNYYEMPMLTSQERKRVADKWAETHDENSEEIIENG